MIKKETMEAFKKRFDFEKNNSTIAGAIAKVGINEASLNNEVLRRHNHMFSIKLKKGDITWQKNSGRCWMFAAMNAARVSTIKKFNLKTIEFSEVYTLFWDKLERSNYILSLIIETVEEPLTSRNVAYILSDPLGDGGQWDMFKAMVKKYGLVPKDHMPETYHSSNTDVMDNYLTSMIRFFAYELREEYAKYKDIDKLNTMKEDMLYKIYNILIKCLGTPPEKVNFEYEDADGKYHRLPEMTPQDFIKEAVGWNLDDKVSIINSPTKDKPYGKLFTVKFRGNIEEADKIKYLNVPIEVMKQATIESLKDGEALWFGCDVGKLSNRMLGILDTDVFNYEMTMGYYPAWTKEKRLEYYESRLTHAMVFTGVNLDENGKPINWQIENSWGEEPGKKGIFSMSDEWFDEFTYQVMIDKKYLPQEWRDKLDGEVIELEPWDPMGSIGFRW